MNSLLVMLGGALGALARYHLGRGAFALFGSALPWGTFAANLLGGLLMGMVAGWLARHGTASGEQWRLLVGVGLLGGFTTFSSYSLEIVLMMERGQVALALVYALASVIGAVLALFGGLSLMRVLA